MNLLTRIANQADERDFQNVESPQDLSRVVREIVREDLLPFDEPFSQRVQRISERLLWPLPGSLPEIITVRDDGLFTAFSFVDSVYVGSELDRLDDGELAFIIAHELGHLQHGDSCAGFDAVMSSWGLLRVPLFQLGGHAREFAADGFARRLAVACGYEDRALDVLRRMEGRDPRIAVRWARYRRIPVVGPLIVRYRKFLERCKYSHPPVEDRIAALDRGR